MRHLNLYFFAILDQTFVSSHSSTFQMVLCSIYSEQWRQVKKSKYHHTLKWCSSNHTCYCPILINERQTTRLNAFCQIMFHPFANAHANLLFVAQQELFGNCTAHARKYVRCTLLPIQIWWDRFSSSQLTLIVKIIKNYDIESKTSKQQYDAHINHRITDILFCFIFASICSRSKSLFYVLLVYRLNQRSKSLRWWRNRFV